MLNLLGLATGMAVALLIGLWVYYQLSYDRFVPGYEQSYQVRFNYSDNGVIRNQAEVCLPLGDALKRDIPEVAHVAPAFDIGQHVMVVKDKHIYGDVLYAGEEFLQVFPLPLAGGDPATALKGPGPSVVITESMARSLFGKEDALNKTVRFGSAPLKVTAVVRDMPRNSSFHFDVLLPFSDFAQDPGIKAATTNWNDAYFQLYVSLRPGADAVRAKAKARQLVRQYAPQSYTTFHREAMLFPLKDWHLYTGFKDGQPQSGLIDYVRMFSIVGILVLLIACINFMNLSTARSERRAREVGVRKVMGSLRGQLILQFLVESLLMTVLAFLLSIALVQAVLPEFDALTGDAIRVPYGSGYFWLILLSLVLATGLVAGSRPAFYLSSFQPVKVLKGVMRIGKAASLPRKALVVLQFTCSIALIISTIIVYQQIQYAKNRPKGYDPNRLIVSRAHSDAFAAFKQAVMESGVVSNLTRSAYLQTDPNGQLTIDNWPGRLPNEPLSLTVNAVGDSDYFRTLGIGFTMGDNFKGNEGADSGSAIINETAVRRMRLKQPLSQYLNCSFHGVAHRLRIVGVVKDALTQNPFAAAEPSMFLFQPSWSWQYTMRLTPTVSTSMALAKLKTVSEKFDPGSPFVYSFVDENYASKFATEMLVGRLAGIFAALAIFISCLGLFGLAAYTAEQRTREIGIRKVLGASVSEVLLLLSGDFILLVGISCAIAAPVAYYFLHQWLAGYYYRITISPLVFVAAAVLALAITAITVGFQSVRSAMKNPVTALRSE
ncbi:ABC transporter permease [Puia dinghuensis]|uniref:ABC transporter permease n=1 Tax=Puia dinghuensis TaxID=1792502 RepID=UPI001E62D5C9|nr:ABC transporter permease [Puia dinghuensis]